MNIFRRIANIWWLGGQANRPKNAADKGFNIMASNLLKRNEIEFIDIDDKDLLEEPIQLP